MCIQYNFCLFFQIVNASFTKDTFSPITPQKKLSTVLQFPRTKLLHFLSDQPRSSRFEE